MINYKFNGTDTEATVDDCKYIAVRIIARRFPAIKKMFNTFSELAENIETIDNFGLKSALLNDTYSATVRLHDNDKYCEKIGKQLASTKVNNKLDRDVERAIRKWVEHQQVLLTNNVLNQHFNK